MPHWGVVGNIRTRNTPRQTPSRPWPGSRGFRAGRDSWPGLPAPRPVAQPTLQESAPFDDAGFPDRRARRRGGGRGGRGHPRRRDGRRDRRAGRRPRQPRPAAVGHRVAGPHRRHPVPGRPRPRASPPSTTSCGPSSPRSTSPPTPSATPPPPASTGRRTSTSTSTCRTRQRQAGHHVLCDAPPASATDTSPTPAGSRSARCRPAPTT